MNIDELFLSGIIPGAPVILCKTEAAALYIQGWMHSYLTHEPPVKVLDDWPEEVEAPAVVITPVHVLGSNAESTDFGIKTVQELTPLAKRLLNVMIRDAMAGKISTVRTLTAAIYNDEKPYSKRKTAELLRELEQKGLIRRVSEKGPYKLLFGRWRPDAAAAKAAGIEISIK